MTQRILNAAPTPAAEIAVEPVVTLDRALVMPPRLILPHIAPRLDQGTTGTCVAHAAYGLYWWAYREKYGKAPRIGEPEVLRFYDLCKQVDHDPDPGRFHGTTMLTAMRTLAGSGFPLADGTRGPRIDGYEFVGRTPEDTQRAILTFGTPVGYRLDWDAQWMHLPRNRILKPPIGQLIGGHALYSGGFDDKVNGKCDIDPNSWGEWSVAGTGIAYVADRYKTPERGYEAWRVTGIR